MEKSLQAGFPSSGTHLQKYARVFTCVEINSSFYRPHKPETYRRWADSVPEPFRFTAKVPKEITHVRRLRDCATLLERFLYEVTHLGSKLGALLVQLPPSGGFDPETAGAFLRGFRARYQGPLALEPRHPGWFGPGARSMLEELRIARVAADPAVVPEAAEPGGWPGLVYRRLHGSPKIYYSQYSQAGLSAYAKTMERESRHGEVYCIFDNTAEGHAIPDALALLGKFRPNPYAPLPQRSE